MSTTDLQLHSGNGVQIVETPASRGRAALTPTSYAEMFRLAEAMHKSKMFGVSTPEQAMVVLMTGLELGFSPAQAFRGIHVINNKPTLSADMMVAICKSRPDVCKFFRLVETTDERATYETQRVGDPEPTAITFTTADAKRAGLLSNPTWQKFPAQMCRARAAAGLTRAVYSDLILGLYTEDEARAIADEPEPSQRRATRNVTPEAAPALGQPVGSEEALRAERREKVERMVSLMQTLPAEERSKILDQVEAKHGVRNVKLLDLAVLDELHDNIQAKYFGGGDAAEPPAAVAAPETEEDPFADAPTLPIDAKADASPSADAPGHGKS